jgi:uncharacterized protein involved in outer membrane biogenesis
MTNPLTQRVTPLAKSLAGNTIVKRVLITIVVLFLLYTGFGFLALPAIIKSEAQKIAPEKIHRQLTIDKVKINPFTLVAQIQGLKLMEPQGDKTFASFDMLNVNLAASSLFRLAPVVQEIKLDKPYVHLVRTADNHYNIDDILAMANSQPPSPEPAKFSLYNIQLNGGHVEVEDMPAKTTHNITDLALGIPFISSLPADIHVFVEPLLSAKINGAPLEIKGKALPFADPKEAVVDLNFDNVDLTRYLGYVPVQLKAKIPSGRLDTKMTASFRQPKDKTPSLVLNGDASLKSLQVNDADGKQVVKLPELAVTLKEMDVFSGHYNIERVGITGLQADLSKDRAGKLNVEKLLPPSKSAAAPAKPAKAEPASSPKMMVSLGELAISNASVHYADEAKAMNGGVEKFNLVARKIDFDAGKNRLGIDSITSDSADAQYKQGASTAPKEAEAAKPAESVPAASKSAANPFLAEVAHLDIKNWSAHIEDSSHKNAVTTVVAPLNLSMQDISTKPGAQSKLDLQATVNKNGKLNANGTVGMSPLHADLALDIKAIDLQGVQPYIADQVNLRLTQAKASSKSKVQIDAAADGTLKGNFKGDASVDGLATVDGVSGNEFLRWKSLAFTGMDIKLQPLAINIDRIALSDFFARVIIDPNGRINLQDITRKNGDGRKSLTEAEARHAAATPATASTAPAQAAAPAPTQKDGKGAATKVAEATQASIQQAAKSMPPIRIKQINLKGGRVRFTDNFIKPNYSANMQDLGGTVTGLSSNEASTADVNLHGVVNNAPLTIGGHINPLRKDLFLDVQGNVRGMELSQLSAYSDKYVGYGIEKGKMSFEVSYKIDGKQLTASNRLMLDQLTFGKENPDPSIKKLPVRLAVALLADRHGMIDVNVPISGSLDDPQFSIGSIVLKIIGNLIVKAVTAPFSLLASAFGGSGGEQMSMLPFDAGRATITPKGEEQLKSLAKALTDRPNIKLDITGRYDPATDVEGLKVASIDRKVRALKTKDMQGKSETPPDEGVTVSKEEYPDLLWRVYKDESFKKPRNVVGMQKKLSVDEMQSLMLSNTTIGNEDLISLGNRRAQAAKDWLTKNGVPADRIFILAPKAKSEGEGKDAAEGSDAKAQANAPFSRADFALHG